MLARRRRWNVSLARLIVRPRVGCCAQLAVVCGLGQLAPNPRDLADGVKEFNEKGIKGITPVSL